MVRWLGRLLSRFQSEKSYFDLLEHVIALDEKVKCMEKCTHDLFRFLTDDMRSFDERLIIIESKVGVFKLEKVKVKKSTKVKI